MEQEVVQSQRAAAESELDERLCLESQAKWTGEELDGEKESKIQSVVSQDEYMRLSLNNT